MIFGASDELIALFRRKYRIEGKSAGAEISALHKWAR